jgi:hypothetical protein
MPFYVGVSQDFLESQIIQFLLAWATVALNVRRFSWRLFSRFAVEPRSWDLSVFLRDRLAEAFLRSSAHALFVK